MIINDNFSHAGWSIKKYKFFTEYVGTIKIYLIRGKLN